MKKTVTATVGLAVFTASSIHAAIWTSYVSIEVPDGAGGTSAQALYEVIYNTTDFADPANITGVDLLTCIFGVGTPGGNYTDAFAGTYPYSTAGNSSDAVGYIDFFGSPFVESFTIGGTLHAQGTDYNPSWAYYVAGGTGSNALGMGMPGSYGSGSFVLANDGFATRQVSNGSFDAWVLSPIDQSTFTPTEAPTLNPSVIDFSSAIRISHIPEPSRALLLLTGMMIVGMRRSRPEV